MAQEKYRRKQRTQLEDALAEIELLKQQLAYMACERVRETFRPLDHLNA